MPSIKPLQPRTRPLDSLQCHLWSHRGVEMNETIRYGDQNLGSTSRGSNRNNMDTRGRANRSRQHRQQWMLLIAVICCYAASVTLAADPEVVTTIASQSQPQPPATTQSSIVPTTIPIPTSNQQQPQQPQSQNIPLQPQPTNLQPQAQMLPTSHTYNNVTYEIIDSNKEVIDYEDVFLDHLGFPQTEKTLTLEQLIGQHHDNEALHQYLFKLHQDYPEITRLYHIGESVEGRKLWVLEVTEEPGKHILMKPEFKYAANMHGNEVVGREMLLHLARLLVENYRAAQEEPKELAKKPTPAKFVKKLLKATRIHIMPTMNPDGYARSEVGCKHENPSRKGRLNANNVDLNRNFPDSVLKNTPDAQTQPEVRAIMKWSGEIPFVLSANLHGGDLVAVYPFDGATNMSVNEYRPTPDDDVFIHLAKSYANSHATMANGKKCYDICTDYHPEVFPEGISNGAAWYSLYGGMQDWIYEHSSCMEITLELGCNQYPAANMLPQYWAYNKRALLNYIREVHRGIKGVITDASSGNLLPDVNIHVLNRAHNVTSSMYGDYFRILLTGYYEILYERQGYETEKVFVSVQNTMPQIVNIKMRPNGSKLPSGQTNSSGPYPTNGQTPETINDGSTVASESSEHSLMVATLVMTIIIVLILILMAGAYVIQKKRLVRSQSISMEMQPTSGGRSASTGISLPPISSSAAGSSGSSQGKMHLSA